MTKRKEKTAPKSEEAQAQQSIAGLLFEERLAAYLNRTYDLIVAHRNRQGAAARFGRDASFVLMVESAEGALRTGNPSGFLSTAVFAIIGAMQSGGHWDDALEAEAEAEAE